MSKTVQAIKEDHHSFSAWCVSKSIRISQAGDICRKKHAYVNPTFRFKPTSDGFKIFSQLLMAGYGLTLEKDGWNINMQLNHCCKTFQSLTDLAIYCIDACAEQDVFVAVTTEQGMIYTLLTGAEDYHNLADRLVNETVILIQAI